MICLILRLASDRIMMCCLTAIDSGAFGRRLSNTIGCSDVIIDESWDWRGIFNARLYPDGGIDTRTGNTQFTVTSLLIYLHSDIAAI
jgi:hypothetical protein